MLEKQIQNKILKFLRNHGGYWRKISDKYNIGMPDVVGCYRGVFVAIEIKAMGKVTTPKQQYELQQIKEQGGNILIAYDVASVEKLIKGIDKKLNEMQKTLAFSRRL